MKTFGLSKEFAEASKTLAANQGLYNGFLAAGLLWGLYMRDARIDSFFLICIVIAGLYGAATTNIRILFVQALPAAIALIFLFLNQ